MCKLQIPLWLPDVSSMEQVVKRIEYYLCAAQQTVHYPIGEVMIMSRPLPVPTPLSAPHSAQTTQTTVSPPQSTQGPSVSQSAQSAQGAYVSIDGDRDLPSKDREFPSKDRELPSKESKDREKVKEKEKDKEKEEKKSEKEKEKDRDREEPLGPLIRTFVPFLVV